MGMNRGEFVKQATAVGAGVAIRGSLIGGDTTENATPTGPGTARRLIVLNNVPARRAAGVHANVAMWIDPALKHTCMVDPVGGGVSFYGTHVKLEPVDA